MRADVDGVPVPGLGRGPDGEALVVLGRRDGVACTAAAEQLSPRGGIEEFRLPQGREVLVSPLRAVGGILEARGHTVVVLVALALPVPFGVLPHGRPRRHGVHAPVDEDAELSTAQHTGKQRTASVGERTAGAARQRSVTVGAGRKEVDLGIIEPLGEWARVQRLPRGVVPHLRRGSGGTGARLRGRAGQGEHATADCGQSQHEGGSDAHGLRVTAAAGGTIGREMMSDAMSIGMVLDVSLEPPASATQEHRIRRWVGGWWVVRPPQHHSVGTVH